MNTEENKEENIRLRIPLRSLLVWPLIVAAVMDVLTFLQFGTVFVMGIVVSASWQAFQWFRKRNPQEAAKIDRKLTFLKKKGKQIADAARTPVE